MDKEPNVKQFQNELEDNIFSEGYGITPNKILHSKKISSFSKILYCSISSLCAQKGYCWAKNKYFADIFGVSTKTVARAIVELQQYLVIKNSNNSQRIIWVNNVIGGKKGKSKKSKEPIVEVIETVEVEEEEKKPAKKEIAKKFTDEDLFLAELLLQKLIYNFPTFENRKVKISDWADDVRKLREIDKASHEQISFMIIWIQGGEYTPTGKPKKSFEPHKFWSKNILSTDKLRKQWFNLVPQLQQELKITQKKSTITQL